MKLKDKVALITGGAGGLGSEAARVLAAEGAHVVVTDISESAARALAESVNGSGYAHNVASEADWTRIVDDVLAKQGRIDILVNAAGIEGDLTNGGALNTTLEEWRRVMSINLDGTFIGCRLIVPHMIERGTGSVINISSIVSFMASATALAYGASKAGVQQLSRSIAWIGAQNGAKVRCNSLHPGVIKTRMTDNIIKELSLTNGLSENETEKLICTAIPFGTRGMPSDIASMILFLASDDSQYMTGTELKVDGGWLMVNAS